MNHEEFNEKAVLVKRQWKAVCHSLKEHWQGSWKDSYAEAFEEGDAHRYAGNGENEFHDIRILEKAYKEVSI